MGPTLAGAILDMVPVDHPAQPGVVDDHGQSFVVVERVLDDVPRHKLVVQLAQRHGEPLRRELLKDGIGLIDPARGLALKADVPVLPLHGFVPWDVFSGVITRPTVRPASAGLHAACSRGVALRFGPAAVLRLFGGVVAACPARSRPTRKPAARSERGRRRGVAASPPRSWGIWVLAASIILVHERNGVLRKDDSGSIPPQDAAEDFGGKVQGISDSYDEQSTNNLGDVTLRQGELDLVFILVPIVNPFDTALDMAHAALGDMWLHTESTETGSKGSSQIVQRPVRQWPSFCHVDTRLPRRRRVAPRRVSAASGAEDKIPAILHRYRSQDIDRHRWHRQDSR